MDQTLKIESLNLPPMVQVGFVVDDMEKALAQYEPLFGPFSVQAIEVEAADYRGKVCDCRLQLAFGKTGDIEIELIQLLEGDSPHGEFLAAGRSGMHHLRFDVDDIDQRIEDARGIGYKPVWYKRYDEDMAFCYMEREGDPLMIEFLQMPDR